MDYRRIYNDFIQDRRHKAASLVGYTERHHVLPKCMGGGDTTENLIRLTAEDHIFAHLLLAKAYGGLLWAPITIMLRPAAKLGISDRGRRAVRIAALAKREQVKRQTGLKRLDVSKALRGKAKSDAHRENLSKSRTGYRDTEQTRAKKSLALKLRIHTPERNAKVSASLRGRQFSSEHCARISVNAKVRHVGSGNPRYDGAIRAFVHDNGCIERLTKYDLAKKYGLNRTCLNYVISGQRRATQGWSMHVEEGQSHPR